MKKTDLILGLCLIPVVAIADSPSESRLEMNKALVREFSQTLNTADWDGLEKILTKDFQRHSQATTQMPEISSAREFIDLQKQFLASFPDQIAQVDMLIAEGDLVAAYATYSGTNTGPLGDMPPTGKAIRFKFMSIFRIADGKIAELWVEWDNLVMLGQLGLYPPPGPRGGK